MLQLPLQPIRAPNFTPFFSTARRFRVTGNFETSAPNEPQIILNTKWSKVPHVTASEPKISILFAIRLVIFKLQDVLKQVHRMTPK